MLTETEKMKLSYIIKRTATLSNGKANPLDGTGFNFASTQVPFHFSWNEYNTEVKRLFPHITALVTPIEGPKTLNTADIDFIEHGHDNRLYVYMKDTDIIHTYRDTKSIRFDNTTITIG